MERFARAAADHTRQGGPTQDSMLALAQSHGIEITRPVEDALAEAGKHRSGYLTITRFSGDGDRLLDEYRKHAVVMTEVGRDHGLIVHVGAKTDAGFLVVNLWPSNEESEAAAQDPRRLRVLEQAGVRPDEIHRDHYEAAQFFLFGGSATSRPTRRPRTVHPRPD
jgi:hypothetical protein